MRSCKCNRWIGAAHALSCVLMGSGGWMIGASLRSEEDQVKSIYYIFGIAASIGAITASFLGWYGGHKMLDKEGLSPGETRVCELAKATLFPYVPGTVVGGVLGWSAYQCSQCVSG